ncbi:hypothetical protein RhiirA5_349123 [Rhizophagus irregularis]|uniref:Uncharacterized protein n=3 Tax=Rhizophagus irregularis TaxID=588596 RepID=A0A2I1E4B5_9GLOM|nr:hypothetical protein GLOIN_2v1540214 [Rhizophagus irregularis DAOM 181602=DAOM 197198]EXX56082.1 hypothetical protein RirG_219240 [Rhizophagus irregularis DAOM 197198w]PKC15365.1 hypothetical protein RhiirA5_349123 [Rhizophagus irregularis]PKC70687.1 hypothetical protein RhiirA1_414044 [Rhizophagus irregularis]PKK80128.1 hypothetical protein RhiirC2_725154 [Rhizophagus irregularis]PKY16951.1 hypothetical protein RhiirB3_403625 [Rhizophagus irregularis]|eukprot:XP_025185084.1 hypothetical protein GLOIN_2v1540214 [Rhizophagus irregularis DAOM 181602=DAOM 197198]
MLRRNPTRLEIRQDDVEQLPKLREVYQKKLSQKPGISGKGKRKSIELEDTIQRQSQQQQQSLQQPQEQPIPIVGTEELRNLKNNMTTQERIGL